MLYKMCKIIAKKDKLNWSLDAIFVKGEIYYLWRDNSSISNKFGIREEYGVFDKDNNPIWFIQDEEQKNKFLEDFYTEKEYRKLKLIKLNENNL